MTTCKLGLRAAKKKQFWPDALPDANDNSMDASRKWNQVCWGEASGSWGKPLERDSSCRMRLLCDPESTRVQSQQHTTQHNARLMAIFQDNLANRASECHCSGFHWSKDDGGCGDNWNYKTCKAPVKSSQPTNQHPTFYRPNAFPVAQPTASEHWRKSLEYNQWPK